MVVSVGWPGWPLSRSLFALLSLAASCLKGLCFVPCLLPLQVKRALNLVQMMRSEGVAPTEITYNVVLRLCGLGGCWAMGLELLGMMEVCLCLCLFFFASKQELPPIDIRHTVSVLL